MHKCLKILLAMRGYPELGTLLKILHINQLL